MSSEQTVTHILSASQFKKAELLNLLEKAREMRAIVERGGSGLLRGKILASLFFEPSTRTSSSFIAAMQRLGGNVIQINSVEYSSIAKGESLTDTVRTMAAYADAIVFRHPTRGSAAEAASELSVPLINAGDGDGEHPTQALIDLFTIQEELNSLDDLHITFVGDLKYGRTVHALIQLLTHFKMRVSLVSPKELRLPEPYLFRLRQAGIPFTQASQLNGEALDKADIMYVTRVQKERFSNAKDYKRLKDAFCITLETMKQAKSRMALLHPLPRVNEISLEVDHDPRAAYFRQVRNGLHVRMALLAYLLKP